jgi:hypothetical protein
LARRWSIAAAFEPLSIELACLSSAMLFYALATILLYLLVPTLGRGLAIAALYPAVDLWVVVRGRE